MPVRMNALADPWFGLRLTAYGLRPTAYGLRLTWAHFLLPLVGQSPTAKFMRYNGFASSLTFVSALLAACGGSDGGTAPVPVRLSFATEPPAVEQYV